MPALGGRFNNIVVVGGGTVQWEDSGSAQRDSKRIDMISARGGRDY